MKNLQNYIFVYITIFFFNISFAQETNYVGQINLLNRTPSMIYLGSGVTIRNTEIKELGYGNPIQINLGLYQSLFQKKKWGFGLHLFGDFGFGNGTSKSFNQFLISGYTSTLENTTPPKFIGISAGAGPQINIGIRKNVMISPIVDFAYVTQKLEGYVVNQNYNFGGITKTLSLYNQPEIKTTGLGITPRLKLQYFFNKNIGFWLEGNYPILPKIFTSNITFTPNGNPIKNGYYNIDQILTGTEQTHEISVNNSGFGFSGGLVFGFGGAKHDTLFDINGNKNIQQLETVQTGKIEVEKFPPQIQALIDEQDTKMISTFQKEKNPNMKVNSLCNFNIEKVEIECNGKDNQGNKKYKVKIYYKNLSTSGVSSLGHYLAACNATINNGNYIEALPSGSATITNLSPSSSAKTIISPLNTQIITFDFVPSSGFSSLHIMGNLIDGNCGNCDDLISLNLPNCCNGCELNPVKATNNSIAILDDSNGTIKVQNTVSSTSDIVKIEADLVSVKIVPNKSDCLKCNDKIKLQDHFVENNQILNNTGWANSGNPTNFGGENSDNTVSRSLTYTTTSTAGINLSTGAQFNHTIGVAPTSCCGDTVEIWIRYTVWDKDCHVCDKLVKSTITRNPTCGATNTGNSTGTGIPNNH